MIEIKGDSNEIEVHLDGKFTSISVFNVNASIQDMLREHGIPESIVVNTTKVQYMNASVLRALFYLARFMKQKGKRCIFFGKKGTTEDFVRLAGMYNVCTVLEE